MRVALVSLGSRGDVQPFIALGDGLRARGHQVVIGAPQTLEGLVKRAGLEFRPIPGDPDEFFRTPEVIASLRKSPSMVKVGRAMKQPPLDGLIKALGEISAVGDDADLVVNSLLSKPAAYGGSTVPWSSASWWPATRTAAYPALGFPALSLGPLAGPYNRLTYSIAARFEWQMGRPVVNGLRHLAGLPEVGKSSPGDLGVTRPYLYPFSPSVLPAPTDWPEQCYVTGYWFWDPQWQPSPELSAFVEDGPGFVVATFGSTWAVHRPEQSLQFLLDAVRSTGRRLILVDGPGEDLPEGVLRVHDVDYGWLFHRADAVIHHGGFGTTAAVVRAGVPQVTVPTYADHPFWAARLVKLGVAGPPVPFASWTSERLTTVLNQVLTDTKMSDRATELGIAVRQENGVGVACEVLERFVAAG